MMIEKKAQGWGFDLIIAAIIFLGGIIFFYFYTLNYPSESEEDFNILVNEGEIIAAALLSEGNPVNWDVNNVVSIGVLTNNEVNETKLEGFYNLSSDEYAKTKNLFNVLNDYYVYFDAPIIINGNVVGGFGRNATNPESLIKITRLTIYKDKPVGLNVEVWK